MVYLEGRIQTREWEDKDGVKRYTTEIVANQMQMLGGKGESNDRAERKAPEPSAPILPSEDDDIPF